MVEPNLRDSCYALVSWLQNRYSNWDGGEQLKGTEERLVRMYGELCWPNAVVEKKLQEQVKVFDHPYDQMLTQKGIKVWILCPHHLLPCKLNVWIGYIPNGGVIGLSKLTRCAVIMGKRPIMQEQYTMELADFLHKALQPQGLGVYVEGTHGCMMSRGVEQEVPVVTSDMRGNFQELQVKTEFLATIGRNCR